MTGALGLLGVLLSLLAAESSYEGYPISDCHNATLNCLHYNPHFSAVDCLRYQIEVRCYHRFQVTMERHNTDRCVWSKVKSAYNNFSNCTEQMAECLYIPWPNPIVELTFLEIHANYFRDCPSEELSDPPPGIVLALVMTPICLIPVMVVLVVLKTKNGDGSS